MALLIFYVLLALGVSFICSVLEAVLLSVTPGFIEHEISRDKAYAHTLAKMKADVDRPLSAILTLNTIAHTMGAAGAGAQWNVLHNNTGEALFAGVLTLLILVASEIIPKTLGAKFWRPLSRPSTHFLRVMIFVLTWVGVLPILRLITRFLGGQTSGHAVSRAELIAMAEISSRSGQLEDEESEILRNLFLFRSSKVRDIMTPRIVVYAVSEELTVQEFLDEALAKPFSRIPVFRKNRDEIIGFILKSDVMAAQLTGGDGDASISGFIREIKLVPEFSSVYQVFQQLTQNNQHLMLVVDEFGGMEGVVTIEDVVETLLGLEIVDELDRNEDMQKLARKLWKQRASKMGIPVDQVEPAELQPDAAKTTQEQADH
ncbi:hypothetical protein NT6N_37330 [Oceaniferula spumae]|uniref:Hemolysin n=1 Tax=Oceaniferula spumae TaxID=2979115 RepID=A0AAT9FRU2_9BACT